LLQGSVLIIIAKSPSQRQHRGQECRHPDDSRGDRPQDFALGPDAEREQTGDDNEEEKRREHVVPLSRQSLSILEEARALSGNGQFVFPALGKPKKPMSENTITAALRRMGFGADEMTAHGFRAMASTLLNESGKWSPDAIERALAHKDGDQVRAAYHRGTHWKERVAMAQWWSDHLDTLRNGAEVLPFRAKKG